MIEEFFYKDGDYRIFRILLVVVLLILFIIITPFFISIHYQISEGEHTGIVTSTETTGIFFKTNKIYFKTDSTSTQEDTYCVLDKNLLEKLRKKQTEKEKITIEYIDYLSVAVYECGSYNGGIVINIK